MPFADGTVRTLCGAGVATGAGAGVLTVCRLIVTGTRTLIRVECLVTCETRAFERLLPLPRFLASELSIPKPRKKTAVAASSVPNTFIEMLPQYPPHRFGTANTGIILARDPRVNGFEKGAFKADAD